MEAQLAGPEPATLRFQDMDDWVREQNEVAVAAQAARVKENVRPQSPLVAQVPKVKLMPDIGALAIEIEALKEMGEENWIGKLQHYRDVHPIAGGGITWVENIPSQPNPRFTTTVLISESAQQFGNSTIGFSTQKVSFTNKKNAKKYAAKKAVDWLIDNNHMPANGVKFPKVVAPIIPQARPGSTTPPRDEATTYAGQVPELCARLGFSQPQYHITPAVMKNTPMWNGYADFGSDPRIDGKVGEVKDVFGKKNAKEAVAQLVISFMKDIEKHRLQQHEDEDKKRKRSGSDSPEQVAKTARVEASSLLD